MNSAIHYKITPASLGGHRFAVELTIEQPDSAGTRLSLPAWIPGSYLIRDFSKHVGKVSATCGSKTVRVLKKDKNSWRVDSASGPVQVNYEVYAHDPSVRGAHLDTRHGFFNGSSVFLMVESQQEQPVSVEICAPLQQPDNPWRVATTLKSAGAAEWGFGLYQAGDYDDLIDHPVEMGVFDLVEFEVAGVPHYFVLTGKHNCLGTRLARDVKKICEQQVELLGELPPMERYLFLTKVEGTGYGGLEHRSSCALVCSRHELPMSNDKVSPEYCRFLGLVSHEYFHLWNIKRIKPAEFLPYDLQSEGYTELLWVFEGITSYYDDLALIRSGVIDEAAYYQLLATMVRNVRDGHGYKEQSLADSSFDAWVKFYKPDSNTPNSVVSYYKKGALVALALDLSIRQRTSDKHSLDEVMRAMWLQYGKPSVGVPEDGFEEMVDQITGMSMRPFFDQMVRDVGDVPLESLFAKYGLDLKAVKQKPEARDENSESSDSNVELGVTLQKSLTIIATVRRNSCAEQAGISAADELVAIDSLKVSSDNIERLLLAFNPGDNVRVDVFRGDQLLSFDVCLDAKPARDYELTVAEDTSPRARQSRRLWLLGETVSGNKPAPSKSEE